VVSPAFAIPLFLSLGVDTFAVAVGLGLSGLDARQRTRFALSFALAEGTMPVVGFLLGQAVAVHLGDAAQYLAVALLLGVGLYTIYEAMEEERRPYGAVPVPTLLFLALSVSLDELAVGFSLGLFHIPLAPAIAYIAVQAFLLTLAGTALGKLIGEQFAERAEVFSGVVLTLFGCVLLGRALMSG